MSPQEAHRRVGHEIPAFEPEPQPCPTRTSQIVFRVVLLVMVFGATVGMCAAVRAAETPTERRWVVWNVTADRPWTSPKGNTADATNETACLLATVDAARFTPAGTRLACRKSTNK